MGQTLFRAKGHDYAPTFGHKLRRVRLETTHLCYIAAFLTFLSFYLSFDDTPPSQQGNTRIDSDLMVNDYSQSFFGNTFSFLSSTTNAANPLLFSESANVECRDYNREFFGDAPLKEGNLHKKSNHNNMDDEDSNNGFVHIISIHPHMSITFQLYGILAFYGGLLRTQSQYINNHNVLIPTNSKYSSKNQISSSIISALKEIGINVIEFDASYIESKTPDNTSEPMYGIEAFSMTDYNKLVMIEYRQQILNNIDNIFTFVTPSAPPERWNGMESNTACFMFEPNKETYKTLVNYLSKTQDWINTKDSDLDSFNTDRGTFQGFLNSIFWNIDSKLGPIYQLGHQWALSTRKLSNERARYFLTWRPSMLKMVEFVDEHPVDSTPRRKYKERVDRILKDEKSKLDWYSVILAEYAVQFWLDFDRALQKCNNKCQNMGFVYDSEVMTAFKYKDKLGEPFPGPNT